MHSLWSVYSLFQGDAADPFDFVLRWLTHLINEAQRAFETATPQEMLGFIVVVLFLITSLLAVGFKGALRGSGSDGGDFGDFGGGGDGGGGDGGGGDGGGG
jgi:uncharacterized membrane protein YgcG